MCRNLTSWCCSDDDGSEEEDADAGDDQAEDEVSEQTPHALPVQSGSHACAAVLFQTDVKPEDDDDGEEVDDPVLKVTGVSVTPVAVSAVMTYAVLACAWSATD